MEGTDYALLSLFADGGAMMYPLMLCSLVALGVIIAKGYTLWQAHRKSKMILATVTDLAHEGRLEDAIALAEATPGPVAAILLTGFSRVLEHRSEEREIEKAVRTTGAIELGFLERGLAVLATIANVAPLLGFLGTVAGMISAFGAIALAGQVEAVLVAAGIKIALITTAAGLIIAIPVNVAYNFFVTRIDKLILEMEIGTATVVNLAWDLEAEKRHRLAGGRVATQGASSPATAG